MLIPKRRMAPRGRILIVDDEANARAALSEILHEDGFVTDTAADGFKALGKLAEFDPDVVLTDLKMPGLDGIGLMEKGREITPGAVFVVMTAFGTIGSAVDAVKRGADNYLTKPLDFEALAAIVEKAMEKSRLVKENMRLRERLRERNVMSHIVGDSPNMQKLLELVGQVAKSRASVLVIGESGTGKELIAEEIHRASPRAKAPLVRLNCAALAEGLLESELFGHEKGAFTGALGRREGRFKQADQGTLFLDEVSEIPAATQVKLLRFLQEKAFERVGGNETLHVDVRIIAATNRDLKTLIADGRFREDLFYRLNVVSLEIPPLRERVEDVAPLAVFFLGRYAEENGNGGVPLAGQRARARKRRRARRRSLRRAHDRAKAPAAGHRPEARNAGHTADPRLEHRRDRALRHPEDARDVRRLDLEGGRGARDQLAQDSIQAARICERSRAQRERPMTPIRVDKLEKTFRQGFFMRRVPAVRAISFVVEEGEIFGFLGPNGAGKTTTIKILTGLIRATSGTATVFGHPVPSPEAIPYVYPYLTPREFVELSGRLSGLHGAELRRRADAALERTGIAYAQSRQVRRLSKGMLQRTGLAAAMVSDPELLLLDEPMSGLDPVGRKEVRDLIVEEKKRGKTVFFSTHILSDVETLCDRVVILRRGEVVVSGKVRELLRSEVRRIEVTLGDASDALVRELTSQGAAPSRVGEHLVVEVEGETNIPKVLKSALESGARVIEVTPRRETLEDLFMRRAIGSEDVSFEA